MRAKSRQAELANNPSLRRSDIACREDLARARVTQLLALNRISTWAIQEIRKQTAAGRRAVSIRMQLHLADEASVT